MSIDSEYLVMFIKTIIILLILDLFRHIVIKLLKFIKNEKLCFFITQKFKSFIVISKIIIVLLIWLSCLSKITTILSFMSAALTIVMKDIIFNFFSGLYIKAKKPFKIEDRIEINGHKGDVVNIHALSFELLEVNSENLIGQSTGVMIHIPNSQIFSYPLRNYNVAFKYVWNEIKVKLPLDADIKKSKKVLLDIAASNEIIKNIPLKLKEELEGKSTDYRIYYNNVEPTIYVRVEGNYIEMSLRYLMHPKKGRYVQSDIWDAILLENKKGNIKLFKE